MNKWFFYGLTALAIASCSSEDFVGDEELKRQNENGKSISLNLVAAPQTRSEGGAAAAGYLNKNFVIYGMKSYESEAPQVVFNNYQVNYVENTANTTTSNSANWEYVGYTNVPDGVTTTAGVVAFSTLTGNNEANKNGAEQSIKYWDYSASQYDFFAYSLGKGDTPANPNTTQYAQASALHKDATTGYTFTLSGTADQLMACYVSDKKEVIPTVSESQVQLSFRNLASKVKLAFYENVPGYSIKEIKFHPSASDPAAAAPCLYAASSVLPTGGTYTITFDSNNKPVFTSSGTPTTSDHQTFGSSLAYTASREYRETTDETTTLYIGRTSDTATPTTPAEVLPNPNPTDLTLKIDYTLLSCDGYGETIEVKGATAIVPAAYTVWKPNCSYTYLFKISDTGLTPITLDAVINTDINGYQETVTTITNPSITTYQKGSNVAENDEYEAGTIYVIVGNGTALTVEGDNANAKLYTVTGQDITEESVANAIATSSATMTITDVTSTLSTFNEIPADDAPHGVALTTNGVKFTAAAGTIYAFEYSYTENTETKKVYKVIKVKATP